MKLNIKQSLSADRMGTEPITRLIFSMSGPALISMMVQCLYNMVDSIFVAKISSGCLAAVSLAFPVQMIIGALSTGIGVGINSGIARNMGATNHEDARKCATNGLFLGLISTVLILLFGVFYSHKFMTFFTTDEEVLTAGTHYLFAICVFGFGGIFTQLSFSILQGTGNMTVPMFSQIAGAVLNIILDPIFIFGFHLNTLGAAIATCIAQAISMLIGFYGVFVVNKNNLPVNLKGFRPEGRIIKDVLAVGIPAALTQATTSIVSTFVNKIIAGYGVTAVAVYGAYNKLSSFTTMPVFGITRGVNPILGYCYGAKNKKRFAEAERVAGIMALVLGIVCFIIFFFFPVPLLKLMSAKDDMMELGIHVFKIMSLSMPFVGVSIVMTQIFPPTGKSYISLISALLRQAGFLLPLVYILSQYLGLDGLWYGIPLADLLNFVFVIIMNIWFYKRVLNKL